ncbi:cytochrome c oxidase assembly protein [Pseudosulfitobacter pseudonitzschiae]|uniref:cytochrome c oxidase assembly protein n=1 Tax=Pseudosulfitobacter pseudonitzschiae TaxID=1402135 RepID=UPI00055D45DA|nr:cytochrome c oxidase assembly protein [Pseudosulfitobacter pseudonitzschiae]MBM1815186.1 cytochrome c oxidase assembly protein [Pseudosulfitobacter pseudonitzschiae]MBM1832177.1 cytochrome c oxidase assembly protein [Pseudosulfitobacter pseudonitzschiae]MBM1837045.1 cytochrome c oxidase assembly protein [Pseudosulfitobacter pseudonitzschiae]MBM1841891.1 cytochrome c oxidase assembly protein [Pseudosulfitobacter pseudonitzschiae]MBM1846759.1 cytochrome c oxidase assembly protein [Pseudosulfi
MKRLQGPQRTVVQLVCVVLVMGGLSWASVPFYNWFCRVTGFGGTPGQVAEGVDHILDQEITVRFDASVDSAMPWEFKPVETKMKVRIGETALAFFEAYNPTDHPIAGSASYNVTPYSAGGFFNKIQCFCFEQQVLEPGERVQMPVTFFVDPEIVDDRDAKYVHTITLSYTFYEIDLPEGYAALDAENNDTNLN